LLDGVHAENLSKRRRTSCASFQFSANGQATIPGNLRQKYDSYLPGR
jgi:hypothetical protein